MEIGRKYTVRLRYFTSSKGSFPVAYISSGSSHTEDVIRNAMRLNCEKVSPYSQAADHLGRGGT